MSRRWGRERTNQMSWLHDLRQRQGLKWQDCDKLRGGGICVRYSYERITRRRGPRALPPKSKTHRLYRYLTSSCHCFVSQSIRFDLFVVVLCFFVWVSSYLVRVRGSLTLRAPGPVPGRPFQSWLLWQLAVAQCISCTHPPIVAYLSPHSSYLVAGIWRASNILKNNVHMQTAFSKMDLTPLASEMKEKDKLTFLKGEQTFEKGS